jgi:pimeloyl-ACP methyl ester carboxylesterase
MLNSPHPVAFARALASSAEQRAASDYMNWLRAPAAEALLAEDDFKRLDRFFTSARTNRPHWYTAERAARYRAVWRRGLTGGLNYYRASPLHPPQSGEAGEVVTLDAASFHVGVPTLVLWGERDQALLPLLLDDLPELVGDLTIERLPEASHWLAHEEPDAVAMAIRSFCVAS